MEIGTSRLSGSALQGLTRTAASAASRAAAPAGGFGDAFQQALASVSEQQNQASRLQQAVVSGAPGASLEETMLAMQKAQIGFQSALHVRNRMVQAYTDIMNMQV